MAKKKLMNLSHVLIFVEGDTDEATFKALIDYYASCLVDIKGPRCDAASL